MKGYQSAFLLAFIFVAGISIGFASPVAAQPGLDIQDFNVPSEATTGEEVEIQLTIETTEMPADWSGQLEFTTFVDNTQVGTQEATVEDGDTLDITIQHTFQDPGSKEVYIEVSGEMERQGVIGDGSQSVEYDLATPTRTVEVSSVTTTVEGAVFTVPDSIQNDVDQLRDQTPRDLAPSTFVLATEDNLYIVFTDQEPQEGYATVEGLSLDGPDIEHDGLEFGAINADSTNFEEPSQLSVTEAYEDSEEYDRQYVEIDAFHRAVSIDYEGMDHSATVGALVEDPIADDELFSSVGGRTQMLMDGIDGNNIESNLNRNTKSALGDLTQPRVITSSTDVEYWDDTEAAASGIIAAPSTPASEFIQSLQQNDPLPTDSNTPILYVTDIEYDSQPVSSVSDISEDPSSYDGQTVTFESNLYMSTVSSARVIQSATGTQTPIDVILHGGAAWDQLPENSEDIITMMAASSVEQNQLTDTHDGTYQITGEVVSTDRIEGDFPQGSILIVYDLERVGPIDTASPNELIENQAASVSDLLEQQANSGVDTSDIEGTDEVDETSEDDTLPEAVEDQVGFTIFSTVTALLLAYLMIRIVDKQK